METITKRDLVLEVSEDTGLTQQQVFAVVQSMLDTMVDQLADGNEVVLRNFGTFQVKKTKPKVGRNPNKPGTDMPIPARAVVKFRPGKEMKERVAEVLPKLA
ncbi:MAG: HU family DNA-binding protein [Verrucomicrobiota bacterium]